MQPMSGPVWAILSIVALCSVLSILQIMAAWVDNQTRRNELKRRVEVIRQQRLQRMKELEEAGVDVSGMKGAGSASGGKPRKAA
jgi:DNA-binding HxlR family transcriptional regulator